MVGLHLDR